MNENPEFGATVTLLLIIVGVLLWLLVDQWWPNQLVVGPLSLGEGHGDCHGITNAGQIVLAICK